MLFEAAMMEPEVTAPTRMVALPRNPNGSESHSKEPHAPSHDADNFDPRREMLERVSRMKEMLARD